MRRRESERRRVERSMDPWIHEESLVRSDGHGPTVWRKHACKWPGKWGRRAEVVAAGTTGSLEGKEDVAMDVSLWGELQRYIELEMVAAQLPVHAFYRSRSVCQKWNSLPWKRAYLQRHSQTWLGKPYFILHGDQACHQAMLVCASDGRWALRPLPAFAFQHDSTSVASGVVCTCETDLTHDRECLVVRGTVFNMHTKVFRRLPPLTVNRAGDFDCTKLAVDASGAYKVLVACGSRQVLVYDSVTGKWSRRASSPVSLFKEEDATHCEGVMYIKWGGRHRDPDPPRPRLRILGPPPPPVLSEPKLCAYNFKDDVWSVLPVAPPVVLRTEQNARNISVKGLGEWRGALRDVTLDEAENVLRVWEFDQEEWVEVDRMPAAVLEWFLDPQGSTFKDPWRLKFIRTCYCDYYIVMWNHGFAQTSGVARLVLYDMALKAWETITVDKNWVCSCPFGSKY